MPVKGVLQKDDCPEGGESFRVAPLRVQGLSQSSVVRLPLRPHDPMIPDFFFVGVVFGVFGALGDFFGDGSLEVITDRLTFWASFLRNGVD